MTARQVSCKIQMKSRGVGKETLCPMGRHIDCQIALLSFRSHLLQHTLWMCMCENNLRTLLMCMCEDIVVHLINLGFYFCLKENPG